MGDGGSMCVCVYVRGFVGRVYVQRGSKVSGETENALKKRWRRQVKTLALYICLNYPSSHCCPFSDFSNYSYFYTAEVISRDGEASKKLVNGL